MMAGGFTSEEIGEVLDEMDEDELVDRRCELSGFKMVGWMWI